MVKPIHNNKEYKAALARIYKLIHSDVEAGTPEADEMKLLILVIEDYEKEHYPVPPPDPIEAIKFRMDQLGMKPADMHKILGSRQRYSDIMTGRRKLTLPMMRRLHKELKIPLETLVGVE